MATILIKHDESELVPEHCVRYFRGADGSITYVVVDVPQQGASLFRVRQNEDRSDALVLHVVAEVASNGHARRSEPE